MHITSTDGAASARGSARGSALTWALFFVVIVAGMIVSHTIYLAANRRDLDVRFRQSALSTSFARSGAMDALSWFQKQGSQPVTAFNPANDAAASPPIEDSMNPALGLVREFEIRGGLWGRYEVRRNEVADVSTMRGQTANSGACWDIMARGYLFERNDKARTFDSSPNRIVAMTSLRTELRSISMAPPAPAAINTENGLGVRIGNYGKVAGGPRPALVYKSGFNPLKNLLSNLVTGSPPTQGIPNYDASPAKVFKMSLDELMPMADVLVKEDDAATVDSPDTPARLPLRIADSQVILVTKNLKITSNNPLRGKVLLIVTGKLEAEEGNGSLASGMIYTTGETKIDGPFTFRGTIVSGGKVEIGTQSGGLVNITYDPGVLDSLRSEVGRYRFARAFALGAGSTKSADSMAPTGGK